MESYQATAAARSRLPIPDKTLNAAKVIADQLKADFGDVFETDYGWASHLFNNKKVSFSQIEKIAERENFESPHKISHKQVHASSYGTLFPLSASPTEDILVAGASIFGLGEPGRQTAQAICLITANLLLLRSQMENTISLQALIPIRDDVWAAFNDAESKIEAQELSSFQAEKGSKELPKIPTIKIRRRKAKQTM